MERNHAAHWHLLEALQVRVGQQSEMSAHACPGDAQQVPFPFDSGEGENGTIAPLHAPQHVGFDVAQRAWGGWQTGPESVVPPSTAVQHPTPLHSQPSAKLPSQSYHPDSHAEGTQAGPAPHRPTV